MHSSRTRTARLLTVSCSARGGGMQTPSGCGLLCMLGSQTPPPRQTLVKILPWPKLRLRAAIRHEKMTERKNQQSFQVRFHFTSYTNLDEIRLCKFWFQSLEPSWTDIHHDTTGIFRQQLHLRIQLIFLHLCLWNQRKWWNEKKRISGS